MFIFANIIGPYTVNWAFPKRVLLPAIGEKYRQSLFCFNMILFFLQHIKLIIRELIISILKSCNRFPIFSLVTFPLDNLIYTLEEASHVETLLFVDPIQLLKQISTMSS